MQLQLLDNRLLYAAICSGVILVIDCATAPLLRGKFSYGKSSSTPLSDEVYALLAVPAA